MKRLGALTCIAVTLMAVLVLTVPLAAQESQPQASTTQQYTVQDLGTLGGTFSFAYGITNNGSVAGFSYMPGDMTWHAFLWRKGVMTDLGTLGGANSIPWGSRPLNEKNEVVGSAETSTPDPFGEDFCRFGTFLTCASFLWRDGVMSALPTLGGNNGNAVSINNRGQAAGGAENLTPDDCGLRLFQRKPVIWTKDQIEELPTLSGDTVGFVNGINDPGQAVGLSTSCTASHAVLWERGTVTYLGSLGGNDSGSMGINNRGQVFGFSYLTDNLTYHGFRWQKGIGMQDLGTLPGDTYSDAWGIDNKGRVVASSCDASFNCRAVLWQGGMMTDLNTLIPADSDWFLVEADGINARGEIVGLGCTDVECHAFLATPKASGAASDSLTAPSNNRARPTVALPENVRKLLQQRQRDRFGVGLVRPQ
jgi:probable HAF family extracellular repeat protein